MENRKPHFQKSFIIENEQKSWQSFYDKANKPKKSLLKMIANLTVLLILAAAPLYAQQTAGDKFLKESAQELKLTSSDMSAFRLTSDHVSSTSRIHHLYYRQQYNGIDVFGANASVHILPSGEKALALHNNFVQDLASKISGASTPTLSAIEAVEAAAAEMKYTIRAPLTVLENIGGKTQKVILSDGGISMENISAELMYQTTQDGRIVLAWNLVIHELSMENWWDMRVDATTGQILAKNNWVDECNLGADRKCNATCSDHSHSLSDNTAANTIEADAENMLLVGGYRVYPMPTESPYYGTRSLVNDPDDATASPFGWHDTNGAAGAEFTITRGNNAHAFENGDNVGFSPDGGAGLVFDFPINTIYSVGNQSESAILTNLFYWNNIMHDVAYQYGFDEASGNFQENNYGNPGAGGDYVNAWGHTGLLCNAFFGTPADGANPTMQMYVGTCGPNNRDGALDNLVVAHEYAHGISNRLTGGAGNVDCLDNDEQMGEGWSDFYGLMLTMESTHTATTPRGVGTFLFDQGAGAAGIRAFPYSTDLAVDPRTYDSIKGTGTFPHPVGSVWTAMLWEMTWALIDQYGYDADYYTGTGGNNMAMNLVTEAMKLQPCSPGFVDGRDAILAADVALYAGANQCLIWEAFAKRGLGLSAMQGNTDSREDGTEAFDVPLACLAAPPVIICPANTTAECGDSEPAVTGLATATSAPGCGTLVITFNDLVTGAGTCLQEIARTWTATDDCGISECTQTITIEDTTPPMVTCAEFSETFNRCPDALGPNVPGAVIVIGPDGSIQSAVGGSSIATLDLSTCISDDCIDLENLEVVVVASFEENRIPGCQVDIINQYEVRDGCGNTSPTTFQFRGMIRFDGPAPVLTCPADVEAECSGSTDPADTGMVTATSGCGTPAIDFTDTEVAGGCTGIASIMRVWTATDGCGQVSECTQTITIVDTTPPTITCPANVTVECDQPTDPGATGNATASNDNCAADNQLNVTFSDVSDQTPTGCGNDTYTITRTWTATDPCGNATNCIQIIEVEDTTPPVITCPADATIECDEDPSPATNGTATATDNCAAVSEIDISFTDISSQTPTGCGQFQYTILRTWQAEDVCGNTSTCVQTINVEDTTPPVITCPSSQTLTCFESVPAPYMNAADYIAGGGTISDNCTSLLSDFTVFSQDDDNGGDNCPGNARVVVRTYFVNDACGNNATCTQTFTYLASTQGPVITSVLPTCYKYCADFANPMESDVTFDTDCSFGATVNITGPTQIGADNCPGTIYRYTYSVTDDCGRTSAPVNRDFIIGNDGPTIECASFNLILECGDPNNADYIDTHLGLVSANSSCELDLNITNSFIFLNFTSCTNSTKVVTFTAQDDCGRTATCTTTITIQDNLAPVITAVPPAICDAAECGGDVNYWFDHWLDYMLDGLEAEDQCDNNVTWTTDPANPQLNTNCDPVSGDAVTTVTFIANDNCGNEAYHVGSFTVENEFPAAFENVPADATVSCGAPIVFGPAPTTTNTCQTTVTMSTSVDDTDPCNVLHTRTWTATDACGGLTTAVSQTITEVDDTDPFFTSVPADATIACDASPVFGTPVADDACSAVTIGSTDSSSGNSCSGSYTRIWTATDDCGNTATASQTLTYSDDDAPVFTSVPSNGMIACDETPVFGTPTASDDCNGATITQVDTQSGTSCSGSYTRTWTATDACGNANIASQTFNYTDDEGPVFTSVPSGGTVACFDQSIFTGTATATDNCSGPASISHQDVSIGDNCNGTVTRTWTAVDACGNTTTASSTFIVNDNVAPTFTSVPPGGTADCDANANFGTPTASDNCGTPNITFADQSNGTGCGGGVTRTWTATDDCGNEATASATLTFSDDEAPVFTSIPGTADVDCDDDLTPEAPTATDNCGAVTVVITDENTNGTLCDNGYATHYTWTATDDCGNTATAVTQVWVNPDDEAPVFTFVPDGDFGDCDNFPPTFGTPEAEDDCGSVTITFIDEYIGNPDGCDENENFDYRRVWTATDACGNTATAKQTFWILVNGPSANVMGEVHTEEDEMVEDVEVTIDGSFGGFSQMYETEHDGAYGFGNLPVDNNYTVTPYSNELPLNGISSFDLILIAQHILAINPLDSPYKIIAADINRSGSVTTMDLVELRQLILYEDTEFQNNDSWRFVEAAYVFPNPENPFATVFPEMVSINSLSADEQHDFVGVKVGDVNGSVVANTLTGGDDRNFTGQLIFGVQDELMELGERYSVTFTANDFTEIFGYQYTLDFDQSQLDYVEVASGELADLNVSNFGTRLLDEGVLTSSWYSKDAISLVDGTPLFTVTFTAKANTLLSEAIQLTSRYTRAEAYAKRAGDGALGLYEVSLRFKEAAVNSGKFVLYQNTPNPFHDKTLIGFNLPEASTASLTVYDVSGRVLFQTEGDFAKGYNRVDVTASELSGPGLLYYRLATPTRHATKKMLLIKH